MVLSLYLSFPSSHSLPCPSDLGIPEPVPEETLPPWQHEEMGSVLAYTYNVVLTLPNAVIRRKMCALSLCLTASTHHYLLPMEGLR